MQTNQMYYFTLPSNPYFMNPNPQFLFVPPQPFYFQYCDHKTQNKEIIPKIELSVSANHNHDEIPEHFQKTEEKSAPSKNLNPQQHHLNLRGKETKNEKKDSELAEMAFISKKKTCIAQSANRNVIPNIMHQLIAFVFKKNRSGNMVNNLLQKEGVEGTTSKRFYGYLSLMKQKINNYINSDFLLSFMEYQQPNFEIYTQREQELYLKICRILVKYFFTHDFENVTLTSVKMRSDKRIDHLKMKRMLLEKIQLSFNE